MSPTVTSLPNGLLRKGLYKIIPTKYATLFQLAFEYLRFISKTIQKVDQNKHDEENVDKEDTFGSVENSMPSNSIWPFKL